MSAMTANSSSSSSSSYAGDRHLLISYSWGAKKDLVVALTRYLREQHGLDVCRDEDGSSVVPPIGGSTDLWMARAIERSHTVIVCVSRAYVASVNCQKEARYAHQRRDRKKLERIVYVMMEEDYTTVSQPDSVDGEMVLWMGNHLWYPLWCPTQAATTGDQIAALLGGPDLGGTTPLPPMPPVSPSLLQAAAVWPASGCEYDGDSSDDDSDTASSDGENEGDGDGDVYEAGWTGEGSVLVEEEAGYFEAAAHLHPALIFRSNVV